MANFVEVPAEVLESHLVAKKFSKTTCHNEVVYIRKSERDPSVQIKVYTSIRVGRTVVRARGKDSIKVAVVFDNGRKSFGIGKFTAVPRVHSVESVLRRTDERLKSAMLRAVEWLNEQAARGGGFNRPAAVPACPRPEDSADAFNREWAALKDEAGRREDEQERAAFLSDPDYLAARSEDGDGSDEEAESESERRAACDEPPHGGEEDAPRADGRQVCGRCQTVKCSDGCCCAC